MELHLLLHPYTVYSVVWLCPLFNMFLDLHLAMVCVKVHENNEYQLAINDT